MENKYGTAPVKRTELEKKLEELTLDYLENHKDKCNRDQRDTIAAIDIAKGVIDTINRSQTADMLIRSDKKGAKGCVMGFVFGVLFLIAAIIIIVT